MNALTIARFTIQEAISRRLILAGLLISLLYVGLFALGFSFVYDKALADAAALPRARLAPTMVSGHLTVLGLYSVNFLASFLALFVSVGAISGEIDAGTLHAVLARPIRRAELIVGRWLAYAGLISLYVGLMAGLLLLVARLQAGYEAPAPGRAIPLMMLAAVLLMSLSLFGSTLLPTLANGVVVFTLYGLAWLAGIIEFVGSFLANQAMINLGILVSLLIPADALWRGASSFLIPESTLAIAGPAAPFASSTLPTTPFLIWATAYPLLFLFLAITAFSRRDL